MASHTIKYLFAIVFLSFVRCIPRGGQIHYTTTHRILLLYILHYKCLRITVLIIIAQVLGAAQIWWYPWSRINVWSMAFAKNYCALYLRLCPSPRARALASIHGRLLVCMRVIGPPRRKSQSIWNSEWSIVAGTAQKWIRWTYWFTQQTKRVTGPHYLRIDRGWLTMTRQARRGFQFDLPGCTPSTVIIRADSPTKLSTSRFTNLQYSTGPPASLD